MPLVFLSPLHKATRQIGIHLEAPCAELGITLTEGHLLSYLRRYAPCPVQEIQRVFGLKPSTLTSVLDRLERRRLVRRRPHPEDGRSLLVAITAGGRRAGDRLQRAIDALEAAVQAAITERDLAGFRRVMAAIGEATGVVLRDVDRAREP